MLCGSGKGTLAGTQLQESDGSVIVENCRAEGISMNGAEKDGAVGGIAGCAKKAYLIDNAVITQNGVSDHPGERICRRDRRSHDFKRYL